MLGSLKIESYKRGIVFSTIFNFFSKLLLFLQSIVIAYYFGATGESDVFFYCYATITLLAVFVNTLDGSVLVPEAMRLNEQEGKEASMKFLTFFMYLYGLTGVVVSLILLINPIGSFLLISNFDRFVLEQNEQVLLLSVPLFTFMILTNLLTNILASHKFFTTPMIVGMINNVLALLFIILFHNSLSISSLLVGLIAGYVINMLLLIYLLRNQLTWNFSFVRIKVSKKILNNIFYAFAGNITSTLAAYVPMYLLSGFGAGVIATLNYGQKTAEAPNQLITAQSSSVLGIKLNELYAKNDLEGVNRVFVASLQFLIFILVPISLMMYLFADTVVSILFVRGAFGQEAAGEVTQFLKYFALQLPMLAVNTTVARLFMARQKIKESFGYQIIFNATLILFIFLGINRLGVVGYPIALVSLHACNVLVLYFLLASFFPEIRYGRILVSFLKIIGINAVPFFLIIYFKNQFLDSTGIVGPVIAGAAYVIVIIGINRYLKVSEDANALLERVFIKVSNRFGAGKS